MGSASWASSAGVARSMRSNRRRDTGPELAVRRELHRRGLRYRVDLRPVAHLRTRADIVFTRQRIAVYIDGCFWHGCPVHGTSPTSNASYWLPKLQANKERDAAVNVALGEVGWTVLRFWEHETPTSVADAVEAAVRP
ncbi:very short patch repair endonuclease [Microbacterium sp. KSW4-17]|uniref:Very short patch repair endonuclease n=1 Tax=Microbacterium galbum TaxID=3075994 RepID=A0ABU3T675_9MICO|nr:very short patch repair endonuclease [Microbacterium sp. KSW4-17]MDU0366877.1 very short patch repair endonuclease [Microbacterium sp. KSW4-17]